MCGIAGWIGRPASVNRLVEALRHRGPDQSGATPPGPITLGATRLRINGGVEGDMPLFSKSGQIAVVVNGEIFNHRELFSGEGSDLRGFAEAFEMQGPEVFSRLRGPFAALVHDRRNDTLFAARDEIGVRPLFVAETHEGFAFGSEIAPLLDLVSGARDERTFDHLLAFQFRPPSRSPWEGIRPILPGTWEKYERSPSGRPKSARGRLSYAAPAVELSLALKEAFELQARTTPKCAVLLSGGLDSSAVLLSLVRAGRKPDLAAVGFFPEAGAAFDERPFAKAVADRAGVPLLEVPITASSFRKAMPEVIRALGGAEAGPGAVSQWILAQALAREGVRVVFSGQGGDELFGGYERHRILHQVECGIKPHSASGYESLVKRLGPDPVRSLLFRGEEFLPHLELERAEGVLGALEGLPKPGPLLTDRTLTFERHVFLPGLLAVDDRTLAAFGMEGRVPLLDPVLARIAAAIPFAKKSPPESPRALFRTLVADLLPSIVRERRDKMGFPVPLELWFGGPLSPIVDPAALLPQLQELGFRSSLAEALHRGRISARGRWFLLALVHSLKLSGARRRPFSLSESA